MDKPKPRINIVASKPDPNCRWCHGTGEVALFITKAPCDCIKPSEIEIKLVDDKVSDDDGMSNYI